MSTLQDRIAELMSATGWSVGELASIAGVSSSAVSQWKDGPTKSITTKSATLLEKASGYSALWLSNGEGEKFTNKSSSDYAEFVGNIKKYRKIPVIGTAKLGDDGFYDELSTVQGGGDGFIEFTSKDPDAYAIRMHGQSMFPAIRHGWYAVIEPNSPLAIGEYVLLHLSDGRKMVKELLSNRRNSVEVMSVNGGERFTFEFSELDRLEAVGAVVSPSKWNPE